MKNTSYTQWIKIKQLNETIISAQAAILFNNNITSIIWSNPNAQKMFGCNTHGQKITENNPFAKTTLRQIKTTIENLNEDENKNTFIRNGGKLIPCSIQKNEHGIILVTQHNKPTNPTQAAQNIVDVIEEPAAVINEKNQMVAQNQKFKNNKINHENINNLKDAEYIPVGNTSAGNMKLVIKTTEQTKKQKIKKSENTNVGEFWTSKNPKQNTRWYFKQQKNDETNKANEIDETNEANETGETKKETTPQSTPAHTTSEQATSKHATSTRFSWEMNAERKFVKVSPELAEAIGNKANKIIGMTWEQAIQTLNVRGGEEVNKLLQTEETWSDKTIFVEVTETNEEVQTGEEIPVDLAGFPTYDKNKQFAGFTGFGVVRKNDAKKINKNTNDKNNDKTRELSSEEHKNFEEITKTLLNDQNQNQNLNPKKETAEQKSLREKKQEQEQEQAIPAAFAKHNVDTSILAKLPIPVVVYRKQKLLFANQKFFDVTGYDNLNSLQNAGGVDALYKKDGNTTIVNRKGKPINAEAKMQCVPWDEQKAMMITLKVKNENHELDNHELNNDELAKAKKDAENENKHKSEFIAKVSHEMRTPLNAIIGFSEIMTNKKIKKIGEDKYVDYANDIKTAGNHALKIVNDLLDVAKIEANKINLNFEKCDVNNIIADAINICQTNANKQKVFVRTNIPNNIPYIIADKRTIIQSIINLVNNSVKFSGAGGQVIISAQHNEDLTIKIRDTGPGMNEKQLNKALRPFQRIETKDNKSANGTGLGLPLTKELVEANNAQFDIQSKPGEGTKAEIKFNAQQVIENK